MFADGLAHTRVPNSEPGFNYVSPRGGHQGGMLSATVTGLLLKIGLFVLLISVCVLFEGAHRCKKQSHKLFSFLFISFLWQ